MNPITITITAATAEAAAAIRQFATETGGSLQEITKHGHAAEGVFMANKMAIMEMEHSARSMADGLISGINPLRMLAMEGPRLMQAGTMMTEEFKTKMMGFLPILGGIGVAIAAGAVAWHFYGDALVDPTKRARELAEALQSIPDMLKQIEIAERAGSISAAQAQKYRDMALGKTPLYNQTTVDDGKGGHAESVKNGAFGLFGESFPQLTTNPNIVNSRTGAVVGQRQLANESDITKYIEQQMRLAKVTDANDKTKATDDALVKLHLEEEKMHRDSLLGIDKEIARIEERYKIELALAKELHDAAVGHSKTGQLAPDEEAKYQQGLIDTANEKKQSIAELYQEQSTKASIKQDEELKRQLELSTQFIEKTRADTESRITFNAEKEGVMRGQNYQEEFLARYTNERAFLALGMETEQEFTKAVEDAASKRMKSEKEYREELRKVAALKEEIARAETESKLRRISSNPYLTDEQKGEQSLPLLQEQMGQQQAAASRYLQDANTTKDDTARYEALEKYYGMQQKIDETQLKINQATMTWGQTMSQTIVKLQTQFGTFASQSAHIFESVFSTAVNSISQGITKLIEGTTTWSRALMQIGTSILNSIIESIVRAIVEATLLAAVTRLAALAGLNLGGGKPNPTDEAAWGAAAMMRAIADLGPIAGPIAFMAELAIGTAAGGSAGSFAEGGYTGDGGQFDPAGVVHRGEFVFSAPVVKRFGVENLEAIHNGARYNGGGINGGGTNGPGAQGGSRISVYAHTDPAKMARAIEQDDAHEKYVVDVMRRNAHKFT